jgi:hypothetical protein
MLCLKLVRSHQANAAILAMIIRGVERFASTPTPARRINIMNTIEADQNADLFFIMNQKPVIARKKSTIGQYSARINGRPKAVIEVKRQIH